MKRKLWFKYFLYILLFCILIFLKQYVAGRLEYSYKRNWGANGSFILMIIIPFIFNLFIGFLLGLEYIIVEFKKVGSWKINLPKLILIGLPSLFFSLTYFLACINNTFIQNIFLIFSKLGTNFVPTFQIILGYVIATCAYKYNEKIEDNQ